MSTSIFVAVQTQYWFCIIFKSRQKVEKLFTSYCKNSMRGYEIHIIPMWQSLKRIFTSIKTAQSSKKSASRSKSALIYAFLQMILLTGSPWFLWRIPKSCLIILRLCRRMNCAKCNYWPFKFFHFLIQKAQFNKSVIAGLLQVDMSIWHLILSQ